MLWKHSRINPCPGGNCYLKLKETTEQGEGHKGEVEGRGEHTLRLGYSGHMAWTKWFFKGFTEKMGFEDSKRRQQHTGVLNGSSI